MAIRLELRQGIPTGERRALRGPLRRTLFLRICLAVTLLTALTYAFAISRGEDVRAAPLLPSGSTGMVVLDLSASISQFDKIARTFRRIAREDEHAGLVIFSDGAYELLPPGSPTRELESLVRFFSPTRAGGDVYPMNPWELGGFRAGTRISGGLEVARQAFLRTGVQQGSILLVSDLDAAQDTQSLSDALVALRRDGIELRVVPLAPLAEHRALFERLVGHSAFLAEDEPEAPVATAEERRLGGPVPWQYLLVGGLLVLLLAANERLLSRLEARP